MKIEYQRSVPLPADIKIKPRLRAVIELTEIVVFPSKREVVSANLSRCCLVPISKNSVLEGLSKSLLRFIQESMSENVLERVLTELVHT